MPGFSGVFFPNAIEFVDAQVIEEICATLPEISVTRYRGANGSARRLQKDVIVGWAEK